MQVEKVSNSDLKYRSHLLATCNLFLQVRQEIGLLGSISNNLLLAQMRYLFMGTGSVYAAKRSSPRVIEASIRSRISFPALKCGTYLGETSTFSPDFGLRAVLAGR